jgi:phosphate binding protein
MARSRFVIHLGITLLALGLALNSLTLAQAPTPAPSSLTGRIETAGSSTVAPVTQRLLERFEQAGFSGGYNNEVLGTGGGFDRFCRDLTADIANASRPISAEERADCEANGREVVEFQIAIDALAVVVSNSNSDVNDLTLDQLAQIFSGRATAWNQVEPGWSEDLIYLYSPGTDSGTFDYFVEEVFDGDPVDILTVPGIQFSEDDNILVQRIETNGGAIGYFGYAYYLPERARLRAVSIEGVAPSERTVNVDASPDPRGAAEEQYPLARPLFIYTSPDVMIENPQVAEFVRFYLETVQDELGTSSGAIGYFPVSEETRAANLDLWAEVMGQ